MTLTQLIRGNFFCFFLGSRIFPGPSRFLAEGGKKLGLAAPAEEVPHSRTANRFHQRAALSLWLFSKFTLREILCVYRAASPPSAPLCSYPGKGFVSLLSHFSLVYITAFPSIFHGNG